MATVQRTSHIVYTAIRQTYTFQCWFLRCSGTKYRAVSLIQYRAVYQMQQRCCNGFKGDGYLCERMTINHINIIYNYYIIFTIRIEGNVAILLRAKFTEITKKYILHMSMMYKCNLKLFGRVLLFPNTSKSTVPLWAGANQ